MPGPVRVQFVGTGDAFGSGGRLQTCIHIAASGSNLLLDCGCSCLIGLQRCGIPPNRIDTVIVSHLHGDHFGGIPFLLLEGHYLSRRTRPLHILGPRGVETQVFSALAALYPGTLAEGVGFPLTFQELLPGQTINHGEWQVQSFGMRHGSSDQALGLKLTCDDRRIAYTGDTEWNANLPLLAEGADLLICECFQFDQPTPSHLDHQTLLAKSAQLNSRKIVLTHAGESVLQRESELVFPLAYDGYIVDL